MPTHPIIVNNIAIENNWKVNTSGDGKPTNFKSVIVIKNPTSYIDCRAFGASPSEQDIDANDFYITFEKERLTRLSLLIAASSDY